MTVKHFASALAALGAAFIIYVGLSYLIAPQDTAPDFGVPTWPRHDGTAFLAVKGCATSRAAWSSSFSC